MRFCQNKKSQVRGVIVTSLLLALGFLLILAVLQMFQGEAEAQQLESICRGSVALRAKTYTEIKIANAKLDEVASPLLCRTIPKNIPEDKDATEESVKAEIATLMTSCWRTFGEGYIKDVFKEGDIISKNCFACYTVNLRETSKFKGEIKSSEFLKYLFESPYKVDEKGDNCKAPSGGFCINGEDAEDCGEAIKADRSFLLIDNDNPVCKNKGKSSCCYTEYSCWNFGGKCSSRSPSPEEYKSYNWLDCPSGMGCYVKNEDFYSYGEYIQRYGGQGNIEILADIKPGETYAISFGSPTESCEVCTKIGLGAGLVGAIAIGVGSGGIGWVILGAVGAYAVGKGGSELVIDDIGAFFERETNTIYLTTLNQILEGENCNLVGDEFSGGGGEFGGGGSSSDY